MSCCAGLFSIDLRANGSCLLAGGIEALAEMMDLDRLIGEPGITILLESPLPYAVYRDTGVLLPVAGGQAVAAPCFDT